MASVIVVLEIVSLLWSHPILTGVVVLMFTTPLFHLVLFFTPLLVSTALCVIALISIGPQIEKIREERQNKMSRNVGVVVERPVNRYLLLRQGRPQRPLGHGGRRWADWVKGIEIHGNTVCLSETHIMRDIADEGLKADFSHDDGGITMTPEDFGGGTIKVDGDGTRGAFTSEEVTMVDRHQQLLSFGGDCQEVNESGLQKPDDPEVKADTSIDDNFVIKVHGKDNVEGVNVVNLWPLEKDLKVKVGTWPDQDGFSGLVPVMEEDLGSSSRPELFNKATFALNQATLKKRKKASWFRRRRIPCLSKALGKLRERICSQIRRIFS